ncbi:MAG: class I SAM-dependent methyltransferase [Planctomycetota bacterium]
MSDEERQRWDHRYREKGVWLRQPSALLSSIEGFLPSAGRALDLGGGTGRHALWLARRGFEVTLADISEVALALATEEAARAGVPIGTVCVDLDREPIPGGPWDVILCFHYLNRGLFSAFPGGLSPGGVLLFFHPTLRNLERHERPPRRHLLEEGEILGLVTGLEILLSDEGWLEEGRHETRLVARRPRGAGDARQPPRLP